MKKNKSTKIRHKAIVCSLLSCLLLVATVFINIPIIVSADDSEINESISENYEKNGNVVKIENKDVVKEKISDSINYNVERVVRELFGNAPIKSSEYLYNLDNASDYIYIEFQKGGYAVFLKETMELMEYSEQGKIEYPNSTAIKYYGGPGKYYCKNNNCFVDTITGERFFVSDESAEEFATQTREVLLSNYRMNEIKSNTQFDYSDVGLITEVTTMNGVYASGEAAVRSSSIPSYGDYSPITATNGFYIDNYQYFLKNPRHGTNRDNTCGAVAAQLMLSYHNYHSDRRIIANNYLCGSESDPEKNPNYCEDPMSMTHFTLGSKGILEYDSSDPNNYFTYIVSIIPSNASDLQVRAGLNTILTTRNNQISGDIIFSTELFEPDEMSDWVHPNGVRAEINEGRPVIVLLQESLGAIDHYAVAYGYQNYTYPGTTESYSGYVVHFGADSSMLNVWVNAMWCVSYITLDINHTHTYSTVGPIGTTERTEYKCNTCGHRTDAAINISSRSRYEERVASLPQNGYTYKDFYLNFATSGIKVFQTFGVHDTILYLMNADGIVLSSDTYSNGYENNAFFAYDVDANTPYILRVSFWNDNITADVKIGITPCYGYSRYEDIYNVSGSPANQSLFLPYHTTEVVRYSPTVDGNYTIEAHGANSPMDTYLYLIDPTSVNPCIFNDDSGGIEASITAYLSANKTYLIIVSAYDITETFGAVNLYIS